MAKLSLIFMNLGVFAAILLVVYGVFVENQLDITRAYSSVVCTSCLGIEEIAPELTFHEKAELTKVKNPIQVILFTMKGCLECLEAHNYIELICEASQGKVSYIEIDVTVNWTIAKQYDVKYVPTIVVGGKKLEGLKAIHDELISAILEFSRHHN